MTDLEKLKFIIEGDSYYPGIFPPLDSIKVYYDEDEIKEEGGVRLSLIEDFFHLKTYSFFDPNPIFFSYKGANTNLDSINKIICKCIENTNKYNCFPAIYFTIFDTSRVNLLLWILSLISNYAMINIIFETDKDTEKIKNIISQHKKLKDDVVFSIINENGELKNYDL